MRDRRSRALAFLSPRQSTDGKSYLQIQADARLGLSDGNAAAYHIKRLRTRAVLTRYTIQIGWRKIGFPADFVILAESDEEAALLRWKGTHTSSGLLPRALWQCAAPTNLFWIRTAERHKLLIR
jgi:hypothetical protein